MIKNNEGNSQGNLLKATAYTNGIFGFEQNNKEALRQYLLITMSIAIISFKKIDCC